MTITVPKQGKNYRLQVGDGGTTEVFANINGEQSLSIKTSPDQLAAESKDDGDYKVKFYGQQEVSILVSGVTKLPDTVLGYLDAKRKTLGSYINIQIVDVAASNAVKFAAPVTVGAFTWTADDKGVVPYSFELSLAGAPTVDTLFA